MLLCVSCATWQAAGYLASLSWVLHATFRFYLSRSAKKHNVALDLDHTSWMPSIKYLAHTLSCSRELLREPTVSCKSFKAGFWICVWKHCACPFRPPLMSFLCPLLSLPGSGRSYRWQRAREGRSCVRSPSMSSPSPAWCGRSTFSSTEQPRKSNKVSTDSWRTYTYA